MAVDRHGCGDRSAMNALSPIRRAPPSFTSCDDALERARRLVVRSHFAGGTRGVLNLDRGSAGFNGGSARARADEPNHSHAADWIAFPACLAGVINRLQGVIIERRPALDLLTAHDSTATLFYLDPPYLWDTRSRGNRYDIRNYRHELSDEDHAELLAATRSLAGMVVLSGYPSPLYDDALGDWWRVERQALADGARPRTEVLWINPACRQALEAGRAQLDLLATAGGAVA